MVPGTSTLLARSIEHAQVNVTHTGEEQTSSFLPPVLPHQLDDLGCGGQAPDFWVAPHGLTAAVYGAPRGSQSFGAKHAFWAWPPVHGYSSDAPESQEYESPLLSSRTQELARRIFIHKARRAQVPRRTGVEVNIGPVVNDSDYRLKLSTGIKFVDTHMATVLDETRVLVDEILVSAEGVPTAKYRGGGVGPVKSAHLVW